MRRRRVSCCVRRRGRCMRRGCSGGRRMSTRRCTRDGMRCASRRTWLRGAGWDCAEAVEFALKSLDRVLACGVGRDAGLAHVVAYGEGVAPERAVPGVLEDYAVPGECGAGCVGGDAGRCGTSTRRRQIADAMVERFYDAKGGGFFDTEEARPERRIGALAPGGSRCRMLLCRGESGGGDGAVAAGGAERGAGVRDEARRRRWRHLPGWWSTLGCMRRAMGWRWGGCWAGAGLLVAGRGGRAVGGRGAGGFAVNKSVVRLRGRRLGVAAGAGGDVAAPAGWR